MHFKNQSQYMCESVWVKFCYSSWDLTDEKTAMTVPGERAARTDTQTWR